MAIETVLRTIKQAVWLGWKVETNWADPLVFAIYYLVKPIASLLILGFMFLVGSGGAIISEPAKFAHSFAYTFIGSSFFIYAVQVMMTMTMLIHEDRAHYEVLKHIYLSPGSLSWYIVGRALNGVMNATISLLLTLGFGLLIFQVWLGISLPINWLGVDFGLLLTTLLLGIACFMALGFLLCGINIMTSKVQFMLNEYVIGILNLFGGVIFLPSLLPSWGQAISSALPVTYFLNSIRFSFLHDNLSFDAAKNLLYLAVTMVATVFIGMLVFRFAMYRARKEGLIDKKEEY